MSDTKITRSAGELANPFPIEAVFEETLVLAERFLDEGEPEKALTLLTDLEKRYVDAMRLFDLIGECLLRLGDNEAGIRYKTFYEVLKASFATALERKVDGLEKRKRQRTAPPAGRSEAASSVEHPRPPVRRKAPPPVSPGRRDRAQIEGLFPKTASMGHELMRQGHFERAKEIFDTLVERHPEDQSLQDARDLAGKKSRERQLLGVFQRWLRNIETMKIGPKRRS